MPRLKCEAFGAHPSNVFVRMQKRDGKPSCTVRQGEVKSWLGGYS
jgi:hypothetical protein